MDKLAKVRAAIERLHEEYRNKKGALYYRKALRAVLYLIDSMQEEPKKCMYSKEDYTDEDRKVLCEDCKEKCEYSKQEESVSEDLEEAIEDAMPDANWYIEENNDTTGEDAYNSIQMGNMFKAGAQWQKKRFEKNRLAACDKQTEEEAEIESDFAMGIIKNEHRQPTFDDAIKYGMRLQKEQMMTKAVDALVHTFDNGYIRVGTQLLANNEYGLKVGDKVKVIVIKED